MLANTHLAQAGKMADECLDLLAHLAVRSAAALRRAASEDKGGSEAAAKKDKDGA